MKEEEEEPRFSSNAPEETINGVLCSGYMVIAKTSVGIIMTSDGSFLQAVYNKEGIMNAFTPEVPLMGNEKQREIWDELHYVAIHCPVDNEDMKKYLSPLFKDQQLWGNWGDYTVAGMLVTPKILELRAFDIHDDIIAQYNLSKEEIVI